jgi:GTPase SAR1 family protein
MSDVKQIAEPDCVLILVGNKVDLVEGNPSARQVNQLEAKQFAQENKMLYIETSAATHFKVNEAFQTLVESNFFK